MGSRKQVTLGEIADRVGVAVSTVSRALQEHPSVRPELRRQIRAIADQLGYEPRSREEAEPERTVGVIVPSIKAPYYARLVTGISRVAETNGVELALRLSRYRQESEARHLNDLLARVDGVIAVAVETAPTVRAASETGRPIVLLDRFADGSLESSGATCAVIADDYSAALQATKYLCSLGHRELLYVSGPDVEGGNDRKYDGFGAATADRPSRTHKLHVPALQIEPSAEVVKEALERDPAITAVVASDDLIAFGAYRAATALGMKVPAELSILGLNGNRMSAGLDLTTVVMPAGQMGRAAMQLIIDLIEGRLAPPQRIELKGSLVMRGSCSSARSTTS